MSTRWAAALALAAASPCARAAAPDGAFVAVRAAGPVVLDGRLEEPAWAAAPAYDGFVQLFPAEGAPPSERTEVKVLYDDHALYVGVVCHDPDPGGIVRSLGRRDHPPYSDSVTIVVDSVHQGRTAYEFTLTAAGVQEDGIFYDDDQLTTDWDAVWEGAVATTRDGWTAELAIPLAALRFSNAPSQAWGFAVKRVIARRHEEIASVLIRRAQRGVASRLGVLTGLEDLRPVNDLEVSPYLAARVTARPQLSEAWWPQPRLLEPSGDIGVDLRTSLGRGLALQATVNPDFGQVEADQIIQNLSRFEPFFPEKRPFFLQGMDLFQSVAGGSGNRPSPQQVFYSRRIGLDAPILAAAKLTGKAGDEVQVGVLESLVTGAGWPLGDAENAPPRQVRLEPTEPFHLAPVSAYPQLAPVPRNLFAGVARWQPAPTRSFGLAGTSAIVAGPPCTPAEAARTNDRTDFADPGVVTGSQLRPPRCDALAGNALAADWNVRSLDGDWFLRGQASGSQWLGSAPLRVVPDGTVFRHGDLGWGGYVSGGRQGGEPWRFEGQWYYESPRLELNALGYQRTQNEQLGRAILHWVRPSGVGPFHSVDLQVGAETHWTTDGLWYGRGNQVWAGGDFQLRSFHSFGCVAAVDSAPWDVREIDRSAFTGGIYGGTSALDSPRPGVPYRRPADYGAQCWFSSDLNGPFHAEGGAGMGRTLVAGPLAPVTFWGANVAFVLRPHPRLETRVDLAFDQNRFRARWVDDGGGAYLFADLHAPDLSATFRQQVVLTPRLTFQAYAQLFTSDGHYGPFWTATPGASGTITPGSLRPADAVPGYDFRSVALAVNVVLRWEYRLGSTLFLVYTRNQRELGYEDSAQQPASLRPHALGVGPTTDTAMVKWTYRIGR